LTQAFNFLEFNTSQAFFVNCRYKTLPAFPLEEATSPLQREQKLLNMKPEMYQQKRQYLTRFASCAREFPLSLKESACYQPTE